MGLKSAQYREIAASLGDSINYIASKIYEVDGKLNTIRRAYQKGDLFGDANNLYLDKSVQVLKELQTQLDTMHTILSQIKVCETKALDKVRYWEAEEARITAETNTPR